VGGVWVDVWMGVATWVVVGWSYGWMCVGGWWLGGRIGGCVRKWVDVWMDVSVGG